QPVCDVECTNLLWTDLAPSPRRKGCVGRKRNRPLLAALPLRRHSRARGRGVRVRARGRKAWRPLTLALSQSEGRRRLPPTQSRQRGQGSRHSKVLCASRTCPLSLTPTAGLACSMRRGVSHLRHARVPRHLSNLPAVRSCATSTSIRLPALPVRCHFTR